MNDVQKAEASAADWIARRDAGNWTEQHQQALEAWLELSTLNRVTYLRLANVWQRAEKMRASLPSTPTTPAARALPHWTRWRVAAAVMLVAVPAAVMNTLFGTSEGWLPAEGYRTAVGTQQQMRLADGSQILLNTDTRLRALVETGDRRVWLSYGEAFFDIAHDPERPFVVAAGNHRIEVLGTRFSVRREGEKVSVVVLDGQVRFNDERSGAVVLKAGAAVVANAASSQVEQKTAAQLEQMLGWREGQLILDNMTLGEAAAEFNRYNARRLVIADAQAAGIRIGGRFDMKNVDAFARLLEQGFALDRRDEENTIIVSSPRSGF